MLSKILLKTLDYIKNKISIIEVIYGKKNPYISAEFALKKNTLREKDHFPIFKDISEYIIKNEIKVEDFIKDLDYISKETITRVLKRAYYLYTHNVLEMKKIFSLEEIIETREVNECLKILKKKLKLPINKYEASIFYYKCGLKYVPQNVLNFSKNKDFIDGGAYVGDSSLIFENFSQPRKIYAFEPEKSNYNLLLKTIKINDLKKIIPINKGLGEKEENLKIKSSGIRSQISEEGDQEVNITTIDKFVFKNNLSIGLIKLDVEGFELEILKGAEKTIKKFKPILLIAIYHNGKQFFETIKNIQIITSGYKFIIRKLDPTTPFVDTELIAWYENC